MDWEKLAETINKYFGPPFLEEDYIKAWVNENGFHLRIGSRDIALDENGDVWAAGTNMGGRVGYIRDGKD